MPRKNAVQNVDHLLLHIPESGSVDDLLPWVLSSQDVRVEMLMMRQGRKTETNVGMPSKHSSFWALAIELARHQRNLRPRENTHRHLWRFFFFISSPQKYVNDGNAETPEPATLYDTFRIDSCALFLTLPPFLSLELLTRCHGMELPRADNGASAQVRLAAFFFFPFVSDSAAAASSPSHVFFFCLFS